VGHLLVVAVRCCSRKLGGPDGALRGGGGSPFVLVALAFVALLVFIMACNHTSFVVLCWNVRGLGDPLKCDIVKDSLHSNFPGIVLLQETKLANVDIVKSASFLPDALNTFISLDASGASRGLLTAWNP
jgi:hypothetical protein